MRIMYADNDRTQSIVCPFHPDSPCTDRCPMLTYSFGDDDSINCSLSIFHYEDGISHFRARNLFPGEETTI